MWDKKKNPKSETAIILLMLLHPKTAEEALVPQVEIFFFMKALIILI